MESTRANHSAPTQYLHKLNMDPSSAFLCHPTEHTQHGSMMEQLNEHSHLPNAGQNWDHNNKSILGFKKIKVSAIEKQFLFVVQYNHLNNPEEAHMAVKL